MYLKFVISLIVCSCVACTGVHMNNATLIKHEEWHHVDLPKKFQNNPDNKKS